MKPFTVGVTGTGSLIGQAIIKSIKKSKYSDQIRLVGFDYFEKTVGSYWCKHNYVLPDILKRDVLDEWKFSMINVLKEEKIKVLFIGLDFELPIFSRLKEEIELETGSMIMVSNTEVIDICNDKYLTYQFLRKSNLFHPLTYLPDEIDSLDIRFPIIVKPRAGARSRDVFVVESRIDLVEKLAKVNNPIIQELVGVMEDEYTCGVICAGDRPPQIIALNRSLKEGNTFKSTYLFSHPRIIYEYLEEVAIKLKPFGACNFQLRLDEKGIPKIFEINARHSGTTYIRSFFGFKEVEFLLEYVNGIRPTEFSLKEGTVVRFFDEFYVDNLT